MMNRESGATTVTRNDEQEIVQETLRLLEEMVRRNELQPEYISNIWITMTQDLTRRFRPAIRQLEGWDLVPLMCSVEIPVQGSLPRCIRFMVQVNTDKSQSEIKHVYLNEAKRSRLIYLAPTPDVEI